MVGVLLDDIAQAPAIGELLFTALQMQNDAGTTLGFLDGGDFELAFTFG